MLILAALASFGYALVNTFGAWMVLRRKPPLAGLFMLAAAVLVVAAVALLWDARNGRFILLGGLLLASLASLLNARLVIGKVRPRNHLLRALAALVIYLLAWAGGG